MDEVGGGVGYFFIVGKDGEVIFVLVGLFFVGVVFNVFIWFMFLCRVVRDLWVWDDQGKLMKFFIVYVVLFVIVLMLVFVFIVVAIVVFIGVW